MVLSVMQQLQPRSVLDIGVGFGKWGHLFREYLEIVHSEAEPERYERDRWQIRIDGIEGFPRYITPAHAYHYDRILIGDMREKIGEVGLYDVIFIGDVIEHLEKEEGVSFLHECLCHSNKALVVTTPARAAEQGPLCDNPLEIHRSFWTPGDFQSLGRCSTAITENDILVAVMSKHGASAPILKSFIPPTSPPLLSRFKHYLRPLSRPLKPILRKTGLLPRVSTTAQRFQGSAAYWEERYAQGGDSGLGSYGRLARFKAQVINDFVAEHEIQFVIEFGVGDGNQLSLLRLPRYTGFDVSRTAIARLKEAFRTDKTKEFVLIDTDNDASMAHIQADLSLSLDVIFHLVEEPVFARYMHQLFSAARRFVIVYSSNSHILDTADHVRHRNFTDYIARHFPDWTLLRLIENPYRSESAADFFFYGRRALESLGGAHTR